MRPCNESFLSAFQLGEKAGRSVLGDLPDRLSPIRIRLSQGIQMYARHGMNGLCSSIPYRESYINLMLANELMPIPQCCYKAQLN